MKRAGVRYEFDELNRLIITDPRDAVQPRRVVEGDLLIGRGNRLVYRARAKPQRDGQPPEEDYVFDGAWRLTKDHRLALHAREDGRRQTLFLHGTLAQADARALSVSLSRQGRDGEAASQRVSLSGRWQADRRNRLTFLVEKAQGDADRLVFDGAWTVDRAHTLQYEYRRPGISRGETAVHTLGFSGAWDLPQASRLVYRLDAEGRSAFEFQAAIQSRSLNAREGKLAYQIGIRLSDGRTVTRRVVLFGVWKLSRDLSVAFEVSDADGRRQALTFRGRYTFLNRNTLSVALSNRRGEPLELSVTFSRRFLDDAELFVRLQRRAEETEALGGVRVRF